MNLNKIFFSYSRNDSSEFALKLATDLKQKGFDVWIDQQDIRAGAEWDLEIQKALESCDYLLFIESEKSVISNNVLDEVYYAIDQRKKVIPVILHDSKTPFRLQRLQHIDFTGSYDQGLANLVNELKYGSNDAGMSQTVEKAPSDPAKPFLKKPYVLFSMVTLAVVVAGLAIAYYTWNHKTAPGKEDPKMTDMTDTSKTGQQPMVIEPTPDSKKEDANIANTQKKPDATDHKKNIAAKPEKAEAIKPANELVISPEAFAGGWELSELNTKARLKSGYLKIEEINDKRAKILTNFQFYYFKTNDTAFLSVFNGFAACNSCGLKKEMNLFDNDIAVGTQKYIIANGSQPGGVKAGDTLSEIGGNNTVQATVILRIIDENTIVIKVDKSGTTPISNGLAVKPFNYIFKFRRVR